MPYELYWNAEPRLVEAYREAEKVEQDQHNFRTWLLGVYIHEAMSVSIANAFREKGKSPIKYSQEPYDVYGRIHPKLSKEEAEAKLARDTVAKLNLLKSRWDAKVAKNNGRTGTNP